MSPAATELSALCRRSALEWALQGGEEYELVFTGPFGKVPKKIGVTPVHCIGRIVPARQGVKMVTLELKTAPLKAKGFSHF